MRSAFLWRPALFTGTFFGVVMAIFTRLNDPEAFGGGAPGLIISAMTAGVPFGLMIGFLLARAYRRATTAARLNDPREMATVARATIRGTVPTDPGLRAAARNLAIHQLNELRRKRVVNVAVLGLFTLSSVAEAIFWSPWWALAAIPFVSLLVHIRLLPGRLQRRIDLLADPP
jgi:hypothetical protein